MKPKPDAPFSCASEDAAQWLSQARDEIDALFGANHAKNNPHLVAMFMQVAESRAQTIVKARSDAKYLDEFSRLIDSLNKFRSNDFPMLLSVLSSPARRPRGGKA